MIYFDNAATTGKKPDSVIRAANYALKHLSANPGRSGHTPSERAALEVYDTRSKVSDFFASNGAESVAFTANCTESLNFIIKGTVSAGDRVVVSDLEHNSVMRPLVKSAADIKVAEVSLSDDEETVENFKKLIDDKTKLVICTGASNVLGKILPIKEIGKLCREMGVKFAVDAAQTAGILPINTKDMCIDYLAVAPHKGLYAPMGVGIMIANIPISQTIIEGGTGTDSVNFKQPEDMPEAFESGTINVPGIVAVGAGIDFINSIGTKRVFKHESELANQLYYGLKDIPSATLYTPDISRFGYVPVVSFNLKGLSSVETASILNNKGIAVRAGLHCAPTAHKKIGTLDIGTVRVCPSIFNNGSEIKYLLNVIRQIKN